MRVISSATILQLNNIIDQHRLQLNRQIVFQDLTRDVSEGSKFTLMIIQRNFLEHLLRTNTTTAEIESLAKQIHLSNERVKCEEKRILNVRLKEKRKDLLTQRFIWQKASKKAEKSIDYSMLQQYRGIKKCEFNLVWHNEVQDKKSKLQRKVMRMNPLLNLENYEGIPVTDQGLEDKFGYWIEEGVILGNIEASDDIKAFMRLPAKFKLYEPLDEKEFRIQCEATSAKQRFSKAQDGDNNITNEDRAIYREQAIDRRHYIQQNEVDFTKMRASDFPSVKFIKQPPNLSERDEITIESQKQLHKDVYQDYYIKNIDNFQYNNLTDQEQRGLTAIKHGIKTKGWTLYETDKSGKLCLDTIDNYMVAQSKHTAKDKESNIEELQEAEDVLYQHTIALTRILNIGANAGDGVKDRICESFKVVDGGAPALTGNRKDHKKDWDPSTGPPTRALQNAKRGPNAAIGGLVTKMIRPVRFEAESLTNTEVISTEELLYVYSEYNREVYNIQGPEHQSSTTRLCLPRFCKAPPMQGNTVVIGSMDVNSLYPSCKSKQTGEHIVNFYKKSNLIC